MISDPKNLVFGMAVFLGLSAVVVILTGVAAFVYTAIYHPTPAEIGRLTLMLFSAVIAVYMALSWMDG